MFFNWHNSWRDIYEEKLYVALAIPYKFRRG